MRGVVVVLSALVVLTACRSGGVTGEPFAISGASNLRERAEQLRALAAAPPTLLSLSKLRVRSAAIDRTFDAKLTLAADRNVIEVLTPLGTAAAVIEISGGRVTLIDHTSNQFWIGSAADASRLDGLAAIPLEQITAAFPLLFGIPTRALVECDVSGSCRGSGAEFTTTVDGLSSARLGSLEIEYATPATPASELVLRHGGMRLDVKHLDVVTARTPGAVEVPRGYEQMRLSGS